jgi:membrane-associated PAP2 superfamily phosphatase
MAFGEQNPVVLKRKTFIINHFVLPGVLLGILFAGLEWSGFDVWLSGHFYDADIKLWPFKDDWLIQKVLHKGGRLVFFALAACMLLLYLWSWRAKSALRNYRRALLFLFLASIAGPIIILVLKNHTHIYCPWDLHLFNGAKPYIRFSDAITAAMPVGHCFPAAHAGSGYTFISLYFFFLIAQPRYRYWGLLFGLTLGGFYGFTQQMRGAHFLSHDVMAFLICWYASASLFVVFFAKQVRWT